VDEFGAYLRACRARVDPASVGVTALRRRTPGLRREEVAVRAHISVSYYVALEQDRGARPSATVVESLADALVLDAAGRAHLHTLAATVGPAAEPLIPADLHEEIARMVAALPDPTYATDERWSLIAVNEAATTLFGPWIAAPGANMLVWMLTSEQARTLFDDWEAEARAQLARYRATSARLGDDPGFLLTASDLARAWWDEQDVASLSGGVKHLGGRPWRYLVWTPAENPDMHLVTFHRRGDVR
jgi:transcriptional regulator with XRE-family HTH domain